MTNSTALEFLQKNPLQVRLAPIIVIILGSVSNHAGQFAAHLLPKSVDALIDRPLSRLAVL